MASLKDNDAKSRKASSLTDATMVEPATAPATPESGLRPNAMPPNGRGNRDTVSVGALRRRRRGWVSVVVDIILLVVIAGLIVGAWFGYRAVREVYAPTWEQKTVVFRVRIENVDVGMLDTNDQFIGKPIWSSDRSNADQLGTVTASNKEAGTGDSQIQTIQTFILTVEANAYYLEGKGYRMGETMLLAGSEGTYRVEGLVAKGMIISMHEKKDEIPPETTPESPAEATPAGDA